jgi:hypothetical protein
MKIKIEATLDEIVQMLKEHLNISSDIELKIVGESDWIHVPTDWKEIFPPLFEAPDTRIEVKYRNGVTEIGYIGDWSVSWKQDGTGYDIAAYRIIK